MERVEGGCPRGGEEEGGRGRRPKGWKGPNPLSHLSSRPQRKKCQKIYCFPEECLLKLQTPMPRNMKEKRKRNLTSFQKIGISQDDVVILYFASRHRPVAMPRLTPSSLMSCPNSASSLLLPCNPSRKSLLYDERDIK
jgi:hypothetical protein